MNVTSSSVIETKVEIKMKYVNSENSEGIRVRQWSNGSELEGDSRVT